MALVSYAKMEKTAVPKGNLVDLKGNWIGSRFIEQGSLKSTDLEISNDTLPVQGKFTFYDLRKRRGRGGRSDTVIIDFKNGKINN